MWCSRNFHAETWPNSQLWSSTINWERNSIANPICLSQCRTDYSIVFPSIFIGSMCVFFDLRRKSHTSKALKESGAFAENVNGSNLYMNKWKNLSKYESNRIESYKCHQSQFSEAKQIIWFGQIICCQQCLCNLSLFRQPKRWKVHVTKTKICLFLSLRCAMSTSSKNFYNFVLLENVKSSSF